jgi:sulfate adenylyltransferase subunit 2
MDHLDQLEAKAIHVFREAYANFRDMGMLWSIGKDSTVLLWLARKAFFGHVPFPLIHIDTHFEIPELIEYRDNLVRKWKLRLVVGQNEKALDAKDTFPDAGITRLKCCTNLRTIALKETLSGTGPRYVFDHNKDEFVKDPSTEPYDAVIAGVRGDEEGTRSKERVFSPRNQEGIWEIGDQPPEFWNQFNTEFAPGTHLRIHPILDWKELDIWEYIQRENIPLVSLYFNQGDGKRYRSLGCYPCTFPIDSNATTVEEIVEELKTGKLSNVAERSGRAQDHEDGGTLEKLRRDGYM